MVFCLGHYCINGSSEPAPVAQAYGDVCDPGHYCPNGTALPEPCPIGTYQPQPGMPAVDDCLACTPGETAMELNAPSSSVCILMYVCGPTAHVPKSDAVWNYRGAFHTQQSHSLFIISVQLADPVSGFRFAGFRFIQPAIFQDDYRLCAVARTWEKR